MTTVPPAAMRTLTRSFVGVVVNSTSTRLQFVVPPSDVMPYGQSGVPTTQ